MGLRNNLHISALTKEIRFLTLTWITKNTQLTKGNWNTQCKRQYNGIRVTLLWIYVMCITSALTKQIRFLTITSSGRITENIQPTKVCIEHRVDERNPSGCSLGYVIMCIRSTLTGRLGFFYRFLSSDHQEH